MLFSTAVAQTNQGSIAGNVSDPSGAMVANAKIVAKERNTGATYQTVSSSAGSYRLPNVNIGSYGIKEFATNYTTLERKSLHIGGTKLLECLQLAKNILLQSNEYIC
jgi:hypothetical protein